jgi:hypothetical protein
MDFPNIQAQQATARITYARARLWLGIASVGALVVLSGVSLIVGLPDWIARTVPAGWAGDAAGLLMFLLLYVAVSLPFDIVGGWILPRRYGRLFLRAADWWSKWLQGVGNLLFVYLICGLILLAAGQLGGLPAAVGVAALMMLGLLLLQWRLASLVGGLRASRQPGLPTEAVGRHVEVVSARDHGFVGGWVGLPGWEWLVIPEHWGRLLSADQLRAQLARRASALVTGGRRRGVLLAMAWNLTGLAVCGVLPGAGFQSLTGLLTTVLWFVLWSFLGLLILPTPSRAGVYECDRHAFDAGVARSTLEATIRALDRLQEDEPGRAAGIERIFHPVPSVVNRLAGLDAAVAPRGAWHAARMTLYLSWACLGLLSRAVHCNCGRPELWVMLPGD